MAQNVESIISKADPSGYYSISPESQKDLATFVKQCRIDQVNLNTTSKAYNVCTTRYEAKLLWWQTPMGVVSISLGGLLTGFLLGSVVK